MKGQGGEVWNCASERPSGVLMRRSTHLLDAYAHVDDYDGIIHSEQDGSDICTGVYCGLPLKGTHVGACGMSYLMHWCDTVCILVASLLC
jgi:hypothetical protein